MLHSSIVNSWKFHLWIGFINALLVDKILIKKCALGISLNWQVIMLYIDLWPGQICDSKVMHRKEVTHSDGSYEKKSRRWAWRTIWDKVKSHGILIVWCTGREWPVNGMTVIFAWWRSNMPFQKLSGRLNYYITRWEQEVSELEIRWVRDKMR